MIPDRFWAKVDRSGECWIWTAATNRGYGTFYAEGKQTSAHRYAYAKLVGPIPVGMFVLHSCDVKSCVNPEHLSLGNHEQNMREASERGRMERLYGERNHASKLTSDQVKTIRTLRGTGLTQANIAGRYGIARSLVSLIWSEKRWPEIVE